MALIALWLAIVLAASVSVAHGQEFVTCALSVTGAVVSCPCGNETIGISFGGPVVSIEPTAFVNCSGAQYLTIARALDLTAVPPNVFADLGALTNVQITETGVTTVSPNAFAGLSLVTNMQLNESPLTTLQSGTFNGLSAVTQLDLSANPNLATLAVDVFAPLTTLQYLTLQGCHLSAFPATLLTPLVSLSTLTLSNNVLTSVGDFCASKSLRQLDVSWNQLSELPLVSCMSQLTSLSVSDNRISSLPAEAFHELSQLAILTMSQNQISTFPPTVFAGLTSLTTLDISDNTETSLPAGLFNSLSKITYRGFNICGSSTRINTLVSGVFQGLSQLNTLTLAECGLHTIESGAFEGLTALSSLDLSNNNLTSLSAKVFGSLTSLRALTLRNTSLVALPANLLESMPGLQFLDMSYNALSHLGVGTFRSGGTLQTLLLSHVKLSAVLPGTFDGLELLTTLDLSYNGLTQIPAEGLRNLTNLAFLSLEGNRLTGIAAAAFGDMTAYLYSLDLSDNAVQRDSDVEVGPNMRLQVLKLNSNALTMLQAGSFKQLPTLQQLFISNNQIQAVDADAFSAQAGIESLSLDGNRMTTIPAEFFATMPNLTDVSMRNNAITKFAAGTFKSSAVLNTVDFSGNALSQLSAGDLDGMTGVVNLNLSANPITMIQPQAFASLSSVTHLLLAGHKISTLENGTFAGLTSLKSLALDNGLISDIEATAFASVNGTNGWQGLSLTNNRLTHIASAVFAPFQWLSALYLSGNPIPHCHYQPTVNAINSTQFRYGCGVCAANTYNPVFDLRGWALPYYLGVAAGMREVGIQGKFAGVSAGSLAAAALASGQDPTEYLPIMYDAARAVHNDFSNAFRLHTFLEAGLNKQMPADVAERVTGRLLVAITQLPHTRYLLQQFDSKQHLIQALLASCRIPPIAGWPFQFEGKWVIDGGLTTLQPKFPGGHRHVTVNCFPFMHPDIKPLYSITYHQMFYPQTVKELEHMFEDGRSDCYRWWLAQPSGAPAATELPHMSVPMSTTIPAR